LKKNNTPIKIKDIAKIADVSVGTVDRVLHNRSDVSDKTRKKVLKIIDELGYKTNIIAKMLASKQQIVFSILIPEEDEYSSYWQKPLSGIERAEEELATFGIKIRKYFFNFSDTNSFKEQASLLLMENPNAVVFAPVFKEESMILAKDLDLRNTPYILLDSNLEEKNNSIAYLGHDSFQSGMVAAKLIHTRTDPDSNVLMVNLVLNTKDLNHLSGRSDGFRSFYTKQKETGTLIELNIHALEEEIIEKRLTQTLKDVSKIMAIFVTNSRVHLIAKYLEKHQLDQKIVLLGYDLIDRNIAFLKKDTIDYLISQNSVEQGYRSLMSLFQSVVMNEKIKRTIYFPIHIIIKENLKYSNNF
jgi:LacI family transcriptional regulator